MKSERILRLHSGKCPVCGHTGHLNTYNLMQAPKHKRPYALLPPVIEMTKCHACGSRWVGREANHPRTARNARTPAEEPAA